MKEYNKLKRTTAHVTQFGGPNSLHLRWPASDGRTNRNPKLPTSAASALHIRVCEAHKSGWRVMSCFSFKIFSTVVSHKIEEPRYLFTEANSE
ncbi:unnamed protein product [Sphenostylis stenocarpa]|uniref:Uncharacterized protein n=1 Tax=Sphenostylis stenocarpa TaxID=92480 RepID=A0AA86T2X7_9FABA|nr:unnamed protein product [Sphenostylis stenocarpa]